jgi:hypothetical protein
MTPAPQLQFLQYVDTIQDEYCDIHLSDYNHEGVKRLPKISRLRWVKGVKLALAPGSGSGRILIGKEAFKVVYAWGGRNRPHGAWNDRTCYTVRITGKDCAKRLRKLIEKIITYEEGSSTYKVSFREFKAAQGIRSVRAYKAMLAAYNLTGLKVTPEKMDAMVAQFTKNWKENKLVILQHRLKNIETDNGMLLARVSSAQKLKSP